MAPATEELIGNLRIVREPGAAGTGHAPRRALAARALRPGEVVVETPALAAGLHGDVCGRRCDYCFTAPATSSSALSRCGRCKAAFYCGRPCQEAAWKGHHKAECGAAAEALAKALAEQGLVGAGAYSDGLLAARCVRGGGVRDQEAAAGALGDLEVLAEDLVKADELERLQRLAKAVASVPKLVPADSGGYEAVVNALRRFRNNNFAVVDDIFVSVGAGVFPVGASLNHSCAPNCLLTYRLEAGRPPTQVVKAMVPIEQGAELCHSYVELAFPAWQRSKLLKETYGFDCSCPLCTGNERDSIDALLVADAEGRYTVAAPEPLPPPGGRSSSALPAAPASDERDAALRKAEGLMQAAAAEEDAEKELRLLTEVCSLRERWLHRRHLEVAAAHAAAHTAAIAAQDWKAAERHCGRLVEQYLEVYPPWHPVTGLQMYTLAELKEQRGATAEARELLQKALGILRLTHGAASTMVKDLEEHIKEL
eukprot:TRINITY_DN124105_c0_g1_i1.p1 TRINITY_DN124105_c0_g1~~TRINITY_DN124105_c0_g1_i1.p1  ORF type:complete len:482 (-),score=135.02 TRINITY_DN124105_c0_g1_i1:63-1508(-)